MERINIAIPLEMEQTLVQLQFSVHHIKGLSLQSTLIADLRVVGDDFDDFYEALVVAYGNAPLFPERYVPAEFDRDSLISGFLGVFPGLSKFVKSPPLTIDMIDRHMRGELQLE